MNFSFPNLSGILAKAATGLLPTGLQSIVSGVLGGQLSPSAAILGLLNGRLDAQEGRSAAKLLGRAVCEQIDTAMEAHGAAVTVDQSVGIGNGLAHAAMLAHARAAEVLAAYPAAQEKVVRLKTAGKLDTDAELIAARAARDSAAAAYKQALIDIARAAAGEHVAFGQ